MKKLESERGQALVIVALLLVGLLAMAGLAIDGGTVYLERRRMQNAADAASLAGTRELAMAICGDSSATDQTIWDEVVSYSRQNGVEDAGDVLAEYVYFDADGNVLYYDPKVFVGPVDGLLIPNGAGGVAALTAITRTTSLMVLVGIADTQVQAHALAITAPPQFGGGMRPFGVPLQLVQTLDPNDPANNSLTVDFDNNGGTINWVNPPAPQPHQGWMNFGYMWNPDESSFSRAIDEAADAHVIAGWMANGWNGTVYGGDYIHAKPGVMASAVCAAPLNTPFYVPVYDTIPVCNPDIPPPKPACPVQGGGYAYHIVGVAGIEITACSQGDKEITAKIVDMIMGDGVPNPKGSGGFGSATCDFHSMAISLWQ